MNILDEANRCIGKIENKEINEKTDAERRHKEILNKLSRRLIDEFDVREFDDNGLFIKFKIGKDEKERDILLFAGEHFVSLTRHKPPKTPEEEKVIYKISSISLYNEDLADRLRKMYDYDMEFIYHDDIDELVDNAVKAVENYVYSL